MRRDGCSWPLFPRYYGFCLGAGALAATTALVSGAHPRLSAPLVLGTVLVGFARVQVLPRVMSARAAGDADDVASFHLLSVRLNMVVLALLLLVGTEIAL